jgi:hypothetical protein
MTGKRRTHCKRGHKFHVKNTGWGKIGKYWVQRCLTCRSNYDRLRYVAKKERLKDGKPNVHQER